MYLSFLFVSIIAGFSCVNDNILTHEIEKIEYLDRIISQQDVHIDNSVEEIIIIEDTAPDYQDIWTEHFFQPVSVNGVDILWVIDPSGSMNDDSQRIIDGISAMMSALPSTGWRLVIIPTDYRYAEQHQEFPLVPGDTPEMAEEMYYLSKLGTLEAGFDAVYGYVMGNSYSQTWMRDDAALLVVFVSDEDDQSYMYLNSSTDFAYWYSVLRSNVYLASIVHLDVSLSLCNTTNTFTGQEYIDATNYFGGQVIDICSEDWTSGVIDASGQMEPYEYWDLQNIPLDSNYIFVFVDGIVFTDWHFNSNENRIYFDTIPAGDTLVEISYYI